MTDYRCPSCDGGFPEAAHDGACPWCGEAMNGSKPAPDISLTLTEPMGSQPAPGNVSGRLMDVDLGPEVNARE